MNVDLMFRAYSNLNNQWLIKDFNLLGEVTCFDLVLNKMKDLNPEIDTLLLLSSIVVTQSIGIKDIKGNLIFGGDLMRDSRGIIFRIYQINGGFVFKADYWNDNINDLVLPDYLILNHCSDRQNRHYLENCEIVGNIFDNK